MAWRGVLVIMSMLFVAHLVAASQSDCGALLKEYHQLSSVELNRQQTRNAAQTSSLYVLRSPATTSLELDQCLLRAGVPASRRCPAFSDHYDQQVADDVLAAVVKQQKCQLMSSREDMSILQHLPEGTVVAAHLQDPVERVVSAYELATEVAAKKLQQHKKGQNPWLATERPHPEDLWPWNQLSNLLLKDMKKRAKQLKSDATAAPGSWVEVYDDEGQVTYVNTHTQEEKDALSAEEEQHLLPKLDPYNNDMVMPLKEFAAHPKVLQLLHNGELLQILGLTNSSRWSKAKEMRSCIRNDAAVADELVDIARKRVTKFGHVGISEDLPGSIELAAAELGLALDGPAFTAGEVFIPGVRRLKVMTFARVQDPKKIEAPVTEVPVEAWPMATLAEMKGLLGKKEDEEKQLSEVANAMVKQAKKDREALSDARLKADLAKGTVYQLKHDIEQLEKYENNADRDKETATTLAAEYLACAAKLKEAAAEKKDEVFAELKMPDGRQVRFEPAARKAIAADVLDDIRHLNALDVKLYEFAKQLVHSRRQEMAAAGKLQTLPALTKPAADDAAARPSTAEE